MSLLGEDKDVAFRKELRLDKILTRPDGDEGLINSGTKMTKGQKARLREAEEANSEKNRGFTGGLY